MSFSRYFSPFYLYHDFWVIKSTVEERVIDTVWPLVHMVHAAVVQDTSVKVVLVIFGVAARDHSFGVLSFTFCRCELVVPSFSTRYYIFDYAKSYILFGR